MPRAALGRVVIVHNLSANGVVDHPAMITRAWSDRPTEDGPVAIDLIVFPASSPPEVFSRVQLFHTEQEARRWAFEHHRAVVAHWPDRS